MASSQHQGEKDDYVADAGSPDHVLPLDAFKSLMPKCEDDLDIPECAQYTIDSCIIEAAARLLYESANLAVRGNRKVVSGEDMVCAIEGVQEKDTVTDAARKEMNARVEAMKRAARIRKAREERRRKAKEAAERKAREAAAAVGKDEEEEAAMAEPEDAGSSTSAGFQQN